MRAAAAGLLHLRSFTLKSVRRLLPSRRNSDPEWEVSQDGHTIGWVHAFTMRTSSTTFYRATGLCPITGKRVNLENSADFDERVATVRAFATDAEPFRGVHWHPPSAGGE